jgi:hypothetical protein
LDSLRYRTGAADRPSGTIEGGEKPVAGCLDLATTKSSELAANQHVVTIEKIPPPAVAEGRRFFCRPYDVGEEHSSKNPVGLGGVADAGQELLDFVKCDIGVAQPWEMIRPRQFDEARSRNAFRHVPADPEFDRQIMWAMQKQRRNADRRENVPNVDFGVHCQERIDTGRTHAHSQHPAPPL